MSIRKDIYKIIKDETKKQKHSKDKNSKIISIKQIRKRISKYYDKDINSNSLLKRLNQIEFSLNYFQNMIISTILSITTGVVISCLLNIVQDIHPSDFNKYTLQVNIIVIVMLAIFIAVPLILYLLWGFVVCYKVGSIFEIRHIFTYERGIILHKLKNAYDYDYECTKM